MNRRTFIAQVGGAGVAWLLTARAQKPAPPMIGFLGAVSAPDWVDQVAALRAGLRDLGYMEGQKYCH